MYIARKPVFGHYEYSLKESYYEEPYWKSRTILNLGPHPEDYITYYSEVAFSIDLEEKLEKLGYKVDQWELERLFFRFLNPEAQRIINQFTRPKSIKRVCKKFSLNEIHPFDVKRRIVLKFGVSNPERFMDNPYPFLDELCEKSRDELENYFWDLEDRLKHREKIRYLLAIFGLSYISSRASQEDIDKMFINNFCEIIKDENFRMGLSEDEIHKNYFCRYVWMYFDIIPFFPKPRGFYLREREVYLKAFQLLGISVEELKRMSKKELLKIFRRKAKEFHPDKGGSHEKFIELRRIFEELIKFKKYD
jgi:hypothetical protein